MCCDIKIWRFQNILLYSKAIKHNKNWDFCTFSIDAFDFLFWPSPMEILQIRGRLTSPWQKGPSDNLCLCHRCNRKEVFSQKLKVSAPMVVTSTSTPKSRKVQFRHVLSEIHGNQCMSHCTMHIDMSKQVNNLTLVVQGKLERVRLPALEREDPSRSSLFAPAGNSYLVSLWPHRPQRGHF